MSDTRLEEIRQEIEENEDAYVFDDDFGSYSYARDTVVFLLQELEKLQQENERYKEAIIEMYNSRFGKLPEKIIDLIAKIRVDDLIENKKNAPPR